MATNAFENNYQLYGNRPIRTTNRFNDPKMILQAVQSPSNDAQTGVVIASLSPIDQLSGAAQTTIEAIKPSKKQLVLTTNDLEARIKLEADLAKTPLKSIWLGENLKLTFSQSRPALFKFICRLTNEAPSQDLGEYGKVVFEDVRAMASALNEEIKPKLKEEKKQRLFKKRVEIANQPKDKSFKNETGFKNKNQLMEFVNKIWNFRHSDDAYSQLKTLIQLQILLPHRAKEIIKSSVSDFDLIGSVWYIKKNNRETEQDNEMLSTEAVQILENYFYKIKLSHIDIINNISAFPDFINLSNEHYTVVFNEFISKISFDYEVNPSKFLNIFKYFIDSDGTYNAKFIDKIIKRNAFSPTELAYYSMHRWALMQWWATNITNFVSAFERSSDSLLLKPATFRKMTTPLKSKLLPTGNYIQNTQSHIWENSVVYPNRQPSGFP
jgi:integrase